LDPRGRVVAHEGEHLTASGGVVPSNPRQDRCVNGSQTILIMSGVAATPPMRDHTSPLVWNTGQHTSVR
jgi:hypothetical protein